MGTLPADICRLVHDKDECSSKHFEIRVSRELPPSMGTHNMTILRVQYDLSMTNTIYMA